MGWGHSGGGSLVLSEVIESHGTALAVDFRREYGLSLTSVVAGDVSPREAIHLIERLPEGSHYHASVLGDEDEALFIGVDKHYRLLAALFDAVNMNTVATGQFKKRPKIEPWPLPEAAKKKREKARKPRDIRSLHAMFSRGL